MDYQTLIKQLREAQEESTRLRELLLTSETRKLELVRLLRGKLPTLQTDNGMIESTSTVSLPTIVQSPPPSQIKTDNDQ